MIDAAHAHVDVTYLNIDAKVIILLMLRLPLFYMHNIIIKKIKYINIYINISILLGVKSRHYLKKIT